MIRQLKNLCKDVRKSMVLLCLQSILVLLQTSSTWLLLKALFITIGTIFLVLLLPSKILSFFCLTIEKVLGSDYKVEVYNSLDILDKWSYNKHAFELRDGDEMIKLHHIEQSIVMKLTSRHCCSTTVKIYSLWESSYEGFAKENGNILVSHKLFTSQPFPEVPVNIHFCSNFYHYFSR